MADEPTTAASSALPVPPSSDMEIDKPEDTIKANDVAVQETESRADEGITRATAQEGT